MRVTHKLVVLARRAACKYLNLTPISRARNFQLYQMRSDDCFYRVEKDYWDQQLDYERKKNEDLCDRYFDIAEKFKAEQRKAEELNGQIEEALELVRKNRPRSWIAKALGDF